MKKYICNSEQRAWSTVKVWHCTIYMHALLLALRINKYINDEKSLQLLCEVRKTHLDLPDFPT